MKKIKYFLFILIFIFHASSAIAAIHYIRQGATGANNGTDWTNAYTNLPTTLVRGDTYYIADGDYGSYTFDDAASGTTLITIKKATAIDHGINTGWLDSYGAGQAHFGKWGVYTDYWLFDGQTRNSNWRNGAVDQYGFHVRSTAGAMRIDDGNGAGADNATFRYIDFEAGGRDTGTGDDTIYGLTGNSNITFQNSSLRDSDRTIFLMRGCWQNLLVENSYLARNASSPAVHGELLSDTCSDNVIFRNNMIEDIEGTGVWAILNGNGSKSAGNTADGWKIYGNVIHWTSGYNREGVAAIIYSANDASNTNWTDNLVFYNNTVYGPHVSLFGVFIEAGSNNTAKNNIFYNTNSATQNGITADYNWYYLTPHNGDSGLNTQTCSSNCTIFTDPANKIFTLSGNSLPNAGDSSIGLAFNTDPNGVIRGADGTWDKGAFEYIPGVGGKPAAPTGLTVQ